VLESCHIIYFCVDNKPLAYSREGPYCISKGGEMRNTRPTFATSSRMRRRKERSLRSIGCSRENWRSDL
ncbi:hypothetical protein AcW1_008236, partial [Taiwanofungus camphoratus]